MKIDTEHDTPTATIEYQFKSGTVLTVVYFDDLTMITREGFEALLDRIGEWRAHEVDKNDN